MATLAHMTRIGRSPGDPRIERTGHSSMTASDRLAKGLGWFSLGLGIVELVAPARITKALGLEGKEGLVRAYGVREIAAGIPTLSVDKQVGLMSRIAGDAVDLATLAPALRRDNPKRKNAMIAMAAVGAVTLLDIVATAGTLAGRRRAKDGVRDFSDRSGLPMGVDASRGLARDARQTIDLRDDSAEPVLDDSRQAQPDEQSTDGLLVAGSGSGDSIKEASDAERI